MANNKQANKTWSELENGVRNINDNLIPSIKNEIESAKEIIEDIKDVKGDIDNSAKSLQGKLESVNELYSKIFEDEDDDDETLANKIQNGSEEISELLSSGNANISKIEEALNKVLGKENSVGIRSGGTVSELEKYKAKYDALFEQIESLLPNATSAGLASAFSMKVEEYESEANKWKWISFSILLMIFGAAFGVLVYDLGKDFTLQVILIKTILKIPFIIFAVWLIVYSNNRRAENKKLSELYKHKEVMAASYIGYKKQIEEIYDDSEDSELQERLLSRLIDAISENSAAFLASTGEKNPIQDVIDNSVSVVKSVVNGNKDANNK